MFLTVHTSSALALSQLPLPSWLIFVLAFFSHYVLDAFPHGDDRLFNNDLTKKQKTSRILYIVTLDGVLAASLLSGYFLYSAPSRPLTTLITVLLSYSPDGLQFANFITDGKIRLLRLETAWHRTIHNVFRIYLSFPIGLLIQIITLSAFLSILI